MKAQISKIIMMAATLIFVGSGVSFAHDWNDRDHKPAGKAYGTYQVKKVPPGQVNKNLRPTPYYSKRIVHKEVRGHHFYNDHHRRPIPRRTVIYEPAKKNPVVIFKVILKNLR